MSTILLPRGLAPIPVLDDRTARLGREWFAEVRQQERDAAAKEDRRSERRETDAGDSDGFWDWGTGDGDSGCDGD